MSKSNRSSWVQFFKDAGIPSSPARRYITSRGQFYQVFPCLGTANDKQWDEKACYAMTFDDNRITKDMLLDLSKEILKEMGITVMGDIISILKHAEKEMRKRERSASANTSGVRSSSSKLAPAAHSTSAGQMAAVSTTSSTTKKARALVGYHLRDPPVDSWTQEIPGAEPVSPYVTHQEAEPDDLIEPEGLPGQQPVMVDTSTLEYGVLQSDQVPVERHPQDKKLFVPATGAMVPVAQIPSELGSGQYVEYTTAAYESGRLKRLLSSLYSDSTEEACEEGMLSPPKHPRVVLLPENDGRQEVYSPPVASQEVYSPATTRVEDNVDRNRRLLEAAGLFPEQKGSKERHVSTSSSVFSRLDRHDAPKPGVMLSRSFSPSSTTPTTAAAIKTKRLAVDVSKPRTVKNTREISKPRVAVSTSSVRSNSSPSKIHSNPFTSGMQSDSSASKMQTSFSTSRMQAISSASKMRSDSSPSSSINSRLSTGSKMSQNVRTKDRISSTTDVSPSQLAPKPGSSAGRLSSRLGVRVKTRDPVTSTSVVTVLKPSSDSGRVSGRLGVRPKQWHSDEPVSIPAAASSSSRVAGRIRVREKQDVIRKPAKSQSPHSRPSMVADDYETRRQLDIRSRLEQREWEKKARRRGPLGGRLAKHHVFGRLE